MSEIFQYRYPHPAVTTDSVIFGFDGHSMHVLLVERGIEPFKGSWALPGGFLNMDETIEECAQRELTEETGLRNVFMEQFHVFSGVNRDPRERVITVAFLALVRKNDYRLLAGDDAADARWFEWDTLPPLAFDHADIIRMARKKLSEMLRTRPIAFKLLDERFKMGELQTIYELVHGTSYDRRNFHRKMLATGYLKEADADLGTPCACTGALAAEPLIDYRAERTSRKCELSGDEAPARKRMSFFFDEEAFDKSQESEDGGKFPFNF